MACIKNAKIKWHETTLGLRANEVITITCYTHTHDMRKKHSCFVNYNILMLSHPNGPKNIRQF